MYFLDVKIKQPTFADTGMILQKKNRQQFKQGEGCYENRNNEYRIRLFGCEFINL
jgi:hypothetical protein